MTRDPRYRYHNVVANAGVDDTDGRVRCLADALSGKPVSRSDVQYAYELFTNPEHRAVVDAFLLAKVPLPMTKAVLDIPEDVLSTYGFLFMDMSVFRNKLEILSFSAAYDGSAYDKELVRTAVSVGPDYLMWAYGAKDDIDTRYVVRRTMHDSFFRGMAHKGNALTSGVAKEAQKWWNTAIRNAEILEKIDPRTSKAAHDELRLALTQHDDTVRPDAAPVPVSEILH